MNKNRIGAALAVAAIGAAQAVDVLPRIEITGSRLGASEVIDSATPVQVITQWDIRKTGATTLADLLGDFSALGGRAFSDRGQDGSLAPGASSAGLRGFGIQCLLERLTGVAAGGIQVRRHLQAGLAAKPAFLAAPSSASAGAGRADTMSP